MGRRLSKITTRTGDSGETGLGDGSRVSKTHPRIEALGAVDELNSVLGLLLAEDPPAPLPELVTGIQHRLFDLGAELSLPGQTRLPEDAVKELEEALETLNAGLAPLEEFVLPGGSRAAALCHLARALCRRAERRAWALHPAGAEPAPALRYLNRLSDLLFVCARHANRAAGRPDRLWRPAGRPSE